MRDLEEKPKISGAVFNVVVDSLGEEGDEVLDDGVDVLVVTVVVTVVAGDDLLHQLTEVVSHIPGAALHEVGLDVPDSLVRGEEVHQPITSRHVESDERVESIKPLTQTPSPPLLHMIVGVEEELNSQFH